MNLRTIAFNNLRRENPGEYWKCPELPQRIQALPVISVS